MADPWQKSKRRSSGKSGERSKRLKQYTFYLDENFDCPEVLELLKRNGVRYRLYSQDVPANSGISDEVFLPKIGDRGWIMITSDGKQRYRQREQYEIMKHRVRQFVLPANMSADNKAKLLIKCKNKIKQLCREHEPPFSASVDRTGKIELRMDRNGNIGTREKKARGAATH